MAIKRPFHAYVLLLGLALIILSGCASSSTGNTDQNAIKAGVGVDLAHKTITLGILSPFSGPVADPIGKPLARGVETFFKSVNDRGGIDGFKVQFVEKDTQYSPQLQVEQYNQIHNQVLMIADSLGTPTTFAIKDLASTDHMLVSAATLSSDLTREKYIVLVGTPYRLQTENAFDYVVNKLGIKNPVTGIIYQNDDYGQDGLTGYKEAIAAYGLHDVAQTSFAATATDFTAQVSQLKAAGAKYVFMTSTPTATAQIMGTAHALGYDPQWILQSPAFSTGLLKVPALVPLLSKAWIISQGAVWGDTSAPGMVSLLNDVKKYAPDQTPDGFFQFGYTESMVTYAILKKAADNHDLTRDGLFNAFESLRNVNLGGLYPNANYGSTPNERVPTRDNVMYQIDPTQPTGIRALSPDFVGTAAQKSQF
ncbi:MAG TPA: ABC transporter substrate-binding protein [Ktedonobacteraceae bacterium]|nr:ABC transporter substrate-binding protein [Ktedonobacteraceae bacterium]